MTDGVHIERCIMVHGGGCCQKRPWVITNCELIDGKDFVILTKRDTGFSRFVSGTSYGIRDMTYLNDIRALRTEATLAIGQRGDSLFDDGAPTAAARKKQRRQASDLKDRGELPGSVAIQLPAVSAPNGDSAEALELRVKSSLDIGANIAVELTKESMWYIRCAMLASLQPDANKRDKVGCSNVRWRKDRNAFVAKRIDAAGKKEYKTFKVNADADDVDLARADAIDAAKRWTSGEDVADGEEHQELRAPSDLSGDSE